jgi:hypothetical protein
MPEILFIVSRDSLGLYAYAKREFGATAEAIEVVIDRRQSERRRHQASAPLERRRTDRRGHAIDAQLRSLGWALVHRSPGAAG